MRRQVLLISALSLSFITLAQQPGPEPSPLPCEDRLVVSRMQIDGLKAILSLKDEELRLLRALILDRRVDAMESRERLRVLENEVMKRKAAIDIEEQHLKSKHKVPVGYVLTEEVQWKKGPVQGVTK